jgi:hypothetical protein
MIRWARKRLRSTRAAPFDPRRLGVERARTLLPGPAVADALTELLARRGSEVGELAGQLVDRLGQLATQVGEEAASLSDSEAASQLRGLAGRTADLAYRSGVERFFGPPPPRKRGSDLGLLLLAAGAGVAVGGGLILLLTRRRTPPSRGGPGSHADRASVAPGEPGEIDEAEQPVPLTLPATQALDRAFETLRLRLQTALAEANRARSQAERRLWREYRSETPEPDELPGC